LLSVYCQHEQYTFDTKTSQTQGLQHMPSSQITKAFSLYIPVKVAAVL
jgi:hypothetical protein